MWNCTEMERIFGDHIKTIPPRFVPYLEKHRIYELFYELATQLAIHRPENHLPFLKQCLKHAALKRDVPRIILIAPPIFDKSTLAKALQREIGIRPVTSNDLQNQSSQRDKPCRCNETELANNMKTLLQSGVLHESGWILVDIPRTKEGAQYFQRIGIIPTHVMQIILPDSSNKQDAVYRRNLRGLREAYENVLIEVEVKNRSMEDLGKVCAGLAKIRKNYGAPCLFRIVLICPRGSGCNDLAKHLSHKFNLVHADFDCLFEQARLQETKLGDTLRLFEYKRGQRPKPEIRIQVVEKFVLGDECLKRGWVLTGYPTCVEDFKLLDMISTPPNKVFFIDSDIRSGRLLKGRYNITTGNEQSIVSDDLLNDDIPCGEHPRVCEYRLEQDIKQYEENIIDMKKYAGESAFTIDGNCEQRTLTEKVESYLMRAPPCAKPREPKPPSEMDPKNVEYDPDEEIDISVYPELRPFEPKFTFI